MNNLFKIARLFIHGSKNKVNDIVIFVYLVHEYEGKIEKMNARYQMELKMFETHLTESYGAWKNSNAVGKKECGKICSDRFSSKLY